MAETALDACRTPAAPLPSYDYSSPVDYHPLQQVSVTELRLAQNLVKTNPQHLDWTAILSTLALCATVYVGCLVIYHLYLTPVAAIPGPFWAKVSSWYEFYYDYVHVGKYYERIREMHEKYGKSWSHLNP